MRGFEGPRATVDGAALPTVTQRVTLRRRFDAVLWLTAVALLCLAGCGSSSTPNSSSSTTTGPPTAKAVAVLINTGIAQADARQYQEAATTFRDALAVSPGNKFAWYNLGLVAQVLNHPSEAVADYSNALSTDPSYTPAMYNEAILLERGTPRSALALYQRIVAINPKAATAYLRESFVYARLGDKAKASQARARAIALDRSLAAVAPPAQ